MLVYIYKHKTWIYSQDATKNPVFFKDSFSLQSDKIKYVFLNFQVKVHTHKELPSSKEAEVILIFLCYLAQSLVNLEFAHTWENFRGEGTSLSSHSGIFRNTDYISEDGIKMIPRNKAPCCQPEKIHTILLVYPLDICVWMIPIPIADLVQEVWKAHQQTDCEFLLFWWCLISLCIDRSLHSTVHTGSRTSDI